MASQVLSGTSNPTYTNNTGQNVRVVINYMQYPTSMSWGSVTHSVGTELAIGKGILNMVETSDGFRYTKEGGIYPVDIALAPTETFSAISGPYNIVVIREDGT